MKIYRLEEGTIGQDHGVTIACFQTKKSLRAYVRTHYPWARGEQRMTPAELYWQWEDRGPAFNHYGWLRGEEVKYILSHA